MSWRRRLEQLAQGNDNGLPNIEIDESVVIEDVRILFDEQLGHGAYGVVYEGDWCGTPVAVKRVHCALVDDQVSMEQRTAFLESFCREWRMFGDLRHPFIVQFLGVFEPRSRSPSLVMELMDMTLRKRCQRAPYLSEVSTVRLCGEVLCALVYLHGRGIVHRDLTTNNVLLTRGEDPTAKISDLGVARALFGDDPRRRVLLSQTGGMTRGPGAILYMSPESMDDSGRRYDTQHDVFSFGVLALSTSTRHEPTCFNQPQKVPLCDGSGNTRIVPEAERRAVDLRDLPPTHPLRAIILECLRDSPSDRPTAREILAKLERLPVPTATSAEPPQDGKQDVQAELDRVRWELMASEHRSCDLADHECTAQEDVRRLLHQLMITQQAQPQQENARLLQQLTTTQQQLGMTRERLAEANERADGAVQRAKTAEQECAELQRLLNELLSQQERYVTTATPATASVRPSVEAAATPVMVSVCPLSSYHWRFLPDIPGDGKLSHHAVHFGEWIVLVGGQDKHSRPCNRVYAYNRTTEHWCEWPRTPYPTCSSASDGCHLYALGSRDQSSSFYRLSDDKMRWLRMPEMPHDVVFGRGAAFHNHRLFVCCGDDAHPGRLQVYDFSQQHWSVFSEHCSTAMPCYKYVLVPWGRYLVANDMSYYNVESDQWHILPRRRSGKVAYSLAVINDQLIALGMHPVSWDDAEPVDVLKSVHSNWSSLQIQPSQRLRRAAACNANNILYVTGGKDTENSFLCFS